jgi:hypothetical protein
MNGVLSIRNQVQYFIIMSLAICLGTTSTLAYIAAGRVEAMKSEITRLKADSRTAWGKVFDLQEGRDDTLFEREASLQVKIWEAEKARDECRAKYEPAK